MKTLAQFISTLTPSQILALGEVKCAFESRMWFRAKIKSAKVDLAEAEKSRTGWFTQDPGDYYEALAVEERRLFGRTVSTSVSMDKYFKKKGHAFVDVGGTREQLAEFILILRKGE